MRSAQQMLNDSLQTGALASTATTLAVAACGAIENRNAIAPLNSVSHIVWGDKAARRDQPSWRYTALGVALNTAAVTSWALIYEGLFGGDERPHPARALIGGVAVSACAYITDYYVVPSRFTPGFEKRLSGRSLFGVYAVLAAGLAFGSLLRSTRK